MNKLIFNRFGDLDLALRPFAKTAFDARQKEAIVNVNFDTFCEVEMTLGSKTNYCTQTNVKALPWNSIVLTVGGVEIYIVIDEAA